MAKLDHRPGYILVIISTAVVLALGILFPTLNQSDEARDAGLYDNNIGDIADKFSLKISPADWAFSIWAFIYTFQAIWVLYSHFLICRMNPSRTGYLYYDPPFLSMYTYVLFMFTIVLTVFWVFTFDQEYLAASFVALVGSVFCMVTTLVFATRDLYFYESRIPKADTWFNVLFVHNAMALFATWLGVASLINLGIIIRYLGDATDTASSVIPLVILFSFILVYFPLDIFVFTHTTRYIFLNYVTWIVALAGILDKNWDADDGVQITAAVLLAFVVLFTIIKIFVTMFRAIRRPLSFEV